MSCTIQSIDQCAGVMSKLQSALSGLVVVFFVDFIITSVVIVLQSVVARQCVINDLNIVVLIVVFIIGTTVVVKYTIGALYKASSHGKRRRLHHGGDTAV
jgi:uncharacterized membrane protein